ncbi:MAG: acyltransferase family protein [Pseudomonadota bacterium]
MQSEPSYRPEIDGLRAVAVLAVVGYHFGLPGFAGGYLGVDIFFVISGYLITGLILREQTEGRFSAANFFARRIRRLLPAQIPVLLFATGAAIWLLLPHETIGFGWELFASLASAANWYFMGGRGYFDAESESRLLLHMWSLGVEEQFYAALVLLLLLPLGGGRKRLAAVFVVLATLSLAHAGSLGETVAFFHPAARAWELLSGALLAVARPALPAGVSLPLRLAGLGAIVASITLGPLGAPPPGVGALPAILGTLAVIAAGSEKGRLPILSNPAALYVGRLSYSLYLWHWPVLVAVRSSVIEMTPLISALTLAAGAAAAALSFHALEQPLRHGRMLRPDRRAIGFAGAAIPLLIALPVALIASGGLPQRYPTELRPLVAAASPADGTETCPEMPNRVLLFACALGPDGPPDLLIFGDSHALVLSEALKSEALDRGKTIQIVAAPACPPIPGVPITGWVEQQISCLKMQAALAAAVDTPNGPPILLSARWSYYTAEPWGLFRVELVKRDPTPRAATAPEAMALMAAGLRAFDEEVRAAGANVTLLTQPPQQRVGPARALHHVWRQLPDTDLPTAVADANRRYALTRAEKSALFGPTDALFAPLTAIDVSDLTPAFCSDALCPILTPEAALYFDDNHLSKAALTRLMPHIFRE